MKRSHLRATLLLFAIGRVGLIAAEAPAIEWPEYRGLPSERFRPVQLEAIEINDQVKANLLARATLVPTPDLFTVRVNEWLPRARIAAFGASVRAAAEPKIPLVAATEKARLAEQLKYFEDTLRSAETSSSSRLPALVLTPTGNGFDRKLLVSFSGAENAQLTLAAGGADAAAVDALRDLQNAIEPYQLNANSFLAQKVGAQLRAVADRWDAFFTRGRPQTFTDVVATTVIEYQRPTHLSGPPPRQWFLLHPNAVLEGVRSAPDGSKTRGALAIEWIGVNYWQGFRGLKLPVGVSLTSLYSDRAEVADVGHGVSVYLDNKYCLGWANHRGRHGFFVSVDTMKLIDSREAKLAHYRDRLQKLLRN